ncbi:MAG: ATP-binding protein [Methanobrevibacter sp.]|nr:ATP-binding protein [Methanobrevibacter sp.]
MKSNLKDLVADLLNAPDRVKFKELLKNDLEEFNELEFKGDYLPYDKLAKHILAMANTGNGLIIFGVEETEDNLDPIGITLKDKTDIKDNLSNYLPNTLKYEIFDYKYENDTEWKKIKNKNFQMITIHFTPEQIPFLSKKDEKSVKQHEIYCRRNNSSNKVRHEDLEQILNTRITSSKNINEFELKKELDELKILTSYTAPFIKLANLYNEEFFSLIENFKERKIKLIEKKLKIEDID